MFNAKRELMPEAFKYVTGELSIENAPKDKDLFKILCAVGVAKLDSEKNEVKVFNSRNMLNSENCVYLTQEQIASWKDLDFTMNFELRGKKAKLDVIVEKLPGDNHATVADSHGNHIFGAVVCLQDSRSPWVFFEGDQRPWALQFTNKQCPNDSGVCAICTGWKKKSINGRNAYFYNDTFEIWSCTKIVRKILSDYFGHEFEHPNADLNNTERARFLRSGDGVYFQDLGDKVLEISKNVGETSGSILLGTSSIGVISVDSIPKSMGVYSGQISFNEDLDPSISRVQIENAVWQMICPNGKTVYSSAGSEEEFGVKPNFKKDKKGKKGKKQFAHV